MILLVAIRTGNDTRAGHGRVLLNSRHLRLISSRYRLFSKLVQSRLVSVLRPTSAKIQTLRNPKIHEIRTAKKLSPRDTIFAGSESIIHMSPPDNKQLCLHDRFFRASVAAASPCCCWSVCTWGGHSSKRLGRFTTLEKSQNFLQPESSHARANGRLYSCVEFFWAASFRIVFCSRMTARVLTINMIMAYVTRRSRSALSSSLIPSSFCAPLLCLSGCFAYYFDFLARESSASIILLRRIPSPAQRRGHGTRTRLPVLEYIFDHARKGVSVTACQRELVLFAWFFFFPADRLFHTVLHAKVIHSRTASSKIALPLPADA